VTGRQIGFALARSRSNYVVFTSNFKARNGRQRLPRSGHNCRRKLTNYIANDSNWLRGSHHSKSDKVLNGNTKMPSTTTKISSGMAHVIMMTLQSVRRSKRHKSGIDNAEAEASVLRTRAACASRPHQSASRTDENRRTATLETRCHFYDDLRYDPSPRTDNRTSLYSAVATDLIVNHRRLRRRLLTAGAAGDSGVPTSDLELRNVLTDRQMTDVTSAYSEVSTVVRLVTSPAAAVLNLTSSFRGRESTALSGRRRSDGQRWRSRSKIASMSMALHQHLRTPGR
jgi:hypothetical protein